MKPTDRDIQAVYARLTRKPFDEVLELVRDSLYTNPPQQRTTRIVEEAGWTHDDFMDSLHSYLKENLTL